MGAFRRIANLFRLTRLDAEIAEELRTHLELHMEDNLARGMTAEEARRKALMRFGNPVAMRERVAASDALPSVESFLRDVRYAARQLRRSPGFAITAILIVALGIGVNVAVFGALNAILLKPLPFPSADRLVRVYAEKDGYLAGPSPLDVRDFAALNHSLEHVAAFDQWRKNVLTTRRGDRPEQQVVGLAPAELFQSIGVRPLLGRLFTADENQDGRNRVALITQSFWNSRYGGTAAILEQQVLINDVAYRIVGVLPDAIPGWLDDAQAKISIWEPFLPEPGFWKDENRVSRNYETIGLLRERTTLAQAEADLNTIARSLAATYPVDRGYGVRLRPLAESRSGKLKGQVLLLGGAVALILLIACANLAGLLLARNTARRREFALRTALGARRAVLVRQILIETGLVSLIGAGVGVGFAAALNAALRARYGGVPQLSDLSLDWRALVFALLLGGFTSVSFGLLPALLSTRVQPGESLKDGGRSGSTVRPWFRKTLTAAQFALSLMLVVAAALMTQSMVRLQRQDMGFRSDHLLRAHFYLPPARYASPAAINRFCDELRTRVQALPGVRQISITTISPPNDRWRMNFSLEGQPVSSAEGIPSALFGVTDEHYLTTLGIRLMRGRGFLETDTESSPAVAIVNEAFVRRFFAGREAVGHSVLLGTPPGINLQDAWMGDQHLRAVIVGVMADYKNGGLAAPPQPQLITLFRQTPRVNFGFKDILIRSDVAPPGLEEGVRGELWALDPTMPLAEAEAMTDYLAVQSWDKRLIAILLGAFAYLGLSLAMVGMYAVISFLVTQRAQEIGVRMVAGATRSSVLWMVVRQGMAVALPGVALGAAGAMLAAKGLSGFLYGIGVFDPATLAASSAALVLVAGLASFIPARRATTIDPARVLRAE